MPLYAIICHDRADAGDLRATTRPSHLDYLQAPGSPVRVAGALRTDGDVPVGSIIVVEVEDEAAARTFGENDPFARAGLFSDMEVRRWTLAIGALA